METVATEWPKVMVGDDGIRPAGPESACFYCGSTIGQPHGFECVTVKKRVEFTARIEGWGTVRGEEDIPWHWDEDTYDFCRNESSWCADNVVDLLPPGEDREELRKLMGTETQPCLCGRTKIKLLRVVDDMPRSNPPRSVHGG